MNPVNQALRVTPGDPGAAHVLANRLQRYLADAGPARPPVVVCIGTDRSTGDSLGPLVGMLLARRNTGDATIYGTLDNPVHAVNLQETMDAIARRFHHPYIIAIDACLGQLASVGTIQLCEGPVKPGAGVNKTLPPVGDIHLTGIVNVGGFMEYLVLQNTRLSVVMGMAELIAESLCLAFTARERRKTTPLPALSQRLAFLRP